MGQVVNVEMGRDNKVRDANIRYKIQRPEERYKDSVTQSSRDQFTSWWYCCPLKNNKGGRECIINLCTNNC